jgi:glycosyltransferase involved in cell wall biosynthesis
MQTLMNECLQSGDLNKFIYSLKDLAIPITDNISPLVIPKCFSDDFRPTAVSVVNYPFANIRHVTFLPPVDGQYRTKDGSPIQTENIYINLETEELIAKMDDNTTGIIKRPSNVKGLEDIRLFTSENKLRFIATSYHEFCEGIGMIIGDYNEDGTYSNGKHIQSPFNARCEKNWLPISNTDNFIYSWNPMRIMKVNGLTLEIVKSYKTPEIFKLFRGSAPPILVGDKLICMIHIVDYQHHRKYFHVFVELDKDTYKPLRISYPFVFKSPSIEYCVGFREIESGFECYPTFMDSNPSRAIVSNNNIQWIPISCTESDKLKIGLCMIVKNEAHIIHESLTATLPLIDTYCIVDTGSSDNTIEVIKKFYEEKGIPGEVHEREWKNFGHNRSEALSLCDGKMDYILVIDADDLIAWEGDGKGDLLRILQTTPNGIEFNIRQGDLSYTRMQMFKANDTWKYVGVLHEYPSNGKPSNKITKCPPTMYMTSRRLGGRNKVADKMKRDIAVLLKGVEDEPDNERYVFYLAQSYRDDGQIEEAVKWYKKRYEMGRWYEEQYISAYNVAKLTHDKEWVWKAHECNPKRIECLVSYMSYCRATNKFSKELLAMSLYASFIKKPTDQHLFVENDVYDWKVWDELSIIAFYCGAKHISKMASERLIADNKAPLQQMERIKNNYKFSL